MLSQIMGARDNNQAERRSAVWRETSGRCFGVFN
jgi:hypothetical protein